MNELARRIRRFANEAQSDFWRAVRLELGRILSALRAILILRGVSRGSRISARGPLKVVRPDRIRLGNRITFAPGMLATHLGCGARGRLVVGDDVVFNYGGYIHAEDFVQIGDRCLFGSMVRVEDARCGARGPIIIEDDVWVAHAAVIRPGVRVGRGSVISAGSIVTKDVPSNSLAIGRPARALSLELVAPSYSCPTAGPKGANALQHE